MRSSPDIRAAAGELDYAGSPINVLAFILGGKASMTKLAHLRLATDDAIQIWTLDFFLEGGAAKERCFNALIETHRPSSCSVSATPDLQEDGWAPVIAVHDCVWGFQFYESLLAADPKELLLFVARPPMPHLAWHLTLDGIAVDREDWVTRATLRCHGRRSDRLERLEIARLFEMPVTRPAASLPRAPL